LDYAWSIDDVWIMFSSFSGSRAFGRKGISYLAGVVARRYNGGYFADDVTWFASQTVSSTTIQVGSISEPASDDGSDFSYQWLGYFRPTTSETYTFYLSSDDASYMWIGANARSGFTTSNALINNGGLHGPIEVSGSIALTAGVYYPIRLQFGERGGGDICTFSFFTPTISKTTDTTGRTFYDPNTMGI
jgi:hypothetical protein